MSSVNQDVQPALGAMGTAAAWTGRAATLADHQGAMSTTAVSGKAVKGMKIATNAADFLGGDHNARASAAGNLGGMAVQEAGGRLVRGGVQRGVERAAQAMAARGASEATTRGVQQLTSGAGGAAVGGAAAAGQFLGEKALGGLLYAIDGERGKEAGENIGGAGGAASGGAAAGALIGGPIGAAVGGGIGVLGWGVGKTAGFCADLIGQVLKGVAHVKESSVELIAEETWSYFCGNNWSPAKKYAEEKVAEDPKNRIAYVTHWAGNHITAKVYRLLPDRPPEFEWCAGDRAVIHEPGFKFQALYSRKFLSAQRDGSLKSVWYYGSFCEAFFMEPVPEMGKGCFMLRTSDNTYVGIGKLGNFKCTRKNPDVFAQRKDSADGVLLYSMRSKRFFTIKGDDFIPGDGSSIGVVGLGNGMFALMLPEEKKEEYVEEDDTPACLLENPYLDDPLRW